MRILHIITGLGTGGAEMMLLKTLPKLKGEHIVCSITSHDSIGKQLEEKNIPVFYLNLDKSNIFTVFYRLVSLCKKIRPDIANTYLLHTNIFARIAARFARIPKVYCSARNVHKDKVIFNILDGMTSALVDRYIANSNSVAQYLDEIGIPKRKITIIPNAVDIKELEKQAKQKTIEMQHPTAICVASFKPQKDHKTLINAFHAMPNWQLLLAGDGSRLKSMKQLAQSSRNIHFLGNRSDIPSLIKKADVLILPSLHEGMPNVLLEAAALNTPIICTDIPENREVVGECATFFKKKDVQGLIAAVESYNNQTKESKKRIEKHYSLQKILKQLNDLYGAR